MTLKIRALRTSLLAPIDLAVADGEAVSVRGPSGSGKTLLLRAIADLDPNEGQVLLDDCARELMSAPEWRRRVRYVAAEPGWWGERVGEHFKDEITAAGSVTRLGLPADCLGWDVARLSTGERQRLGFLRALEGMPRVLLLDEPTAALDEVSAKAVETLIRESLAQGLSALLVTHSEEQAARIAGRHFEMENGTLTPRKT
jgi:ABC-type iron transport system FetAB ATPase subunit